MSISALRWSFHTTVKPASQKLLLIALANFANDSEEAYPSYETLERITSLNRKTIISGMAELAGKKLICDTGKRLGATRSIQVFRLSVTPDPVVPKPEPLSCPENGTTQDGKQSRFYLEAVPFLPGSGPVFTGKRSQKRDTEPLLTLKEPKKEPVRTGTFKKPSVEEVREYMREIEFDDGKAEGFFDYYEANGWRVGKVPMRDWKATVRTWRRRDTVSATPKRPWLE